MTHPLPPAQLNASPDFRFYHLVCSHCHCMHSAPWSACVAHLSSQHAAVFMFVAPKQLFGDVRLQQHAQRQGLIVHSLAECASPGQHACRPVSGCPRCACCAARRCRAASRHCRAVKPEMATTTRTMPATCRPRANGAAVVRPVHAGGRPKVSSTATVAPAPCTGSRPRAWGLRRPCMWQLQLIAYRAAHLHR